MKTMEMYAELETRYSAALAEAERIKDALDLLKSLGDIKVKATKKARKNTGRLPRGFWRNIALQVGHDVEVFGVEDVVERAAQTDVADTISDLQRRAQLACEDMRRKGVLKEDGERFQYRIAA